MRSPNEIIDTMHEKSIASLGGSSHGELVFLLAELNKKQQLANEIAYQQLRFDVHPDGITVTDPIHKILADLNERIG